MQGGGFDTIDANHCSVSTLINLPGELFQMLSSAGPYLHRDAALLQKVIFSCSSLFFISSMAGMKIALVFFFFIANILIEFWFFHQTFLIF